VIAYTRIHVLWWTDNRSARASFANVVTWLLRLDLLGHKFVLWLLEWGYPYGESQDSAPVQFTTSVKINKDDDDDDSVNNVHARWEVKTQYSQNTEVLNAQLGQPTHACGALCIMNVSARRFGVAWRYHFIPGVGACLLCWKHTHTCIIITHRLGLRRPASVTYEDE